MWSFGAAAAPPKLRAWEAQEGASSTDMQRPGSSAGGGGMAYMVPFQSQGSQGQGGLPGGAATPQAAGMRLDSRQDSFGYKRATPLLSLTQKRQSEVLSQQQLMHQQQQQQEQQMQMLSNTRRISLGAPQPQPYWQLQQQLQQEQQQQQYQPHPLPLAPQQQQQVQQQQQQQQQMGYGQQRGIAQQQQPFARQQQMQQQQQMMMQQQQLLLQQQQQLHYQQQLQQHQQSVQQRQSLLQPVTMRTSLGGQSQGPPGRRTSVSMSAPQVRVSDSGSLQQQQAMADNRLLVHNSTSLTATPRVSSMTSAQGAAALSQKVQSGLSIGAVQAKLRESSGQPLRPTPLSGEPLPAPPVAGLSTSRRPAVEPQRPWTANLAPQPQPTQPQPASRTGAVAQRNGPAMPRPAAAPTETSQAEPHYDLDSEFEADYAVQRRMSETYNRAIEAPTQARAVRQPTLVAEEEEEEEEGGQEELEKPFVPGESLLRWLADNVAQMRSKGRLLY